MRHTTLLLVSFLLFSACNSVKRNQKYLNRGDYDQAIDLAVKKLQKDKDAERYEDHMILLEEAYNKAVTEDLRRISFLKKDNSNNAIRDIYYTYSRLENRQQLLRPLLPLYSEKLNRNLRLPMQDYSDELLGAKALYAERLYQEALMYLDRNNTASARTAYEILKTLNALKPYYKDVSTLLDEARYRGTEFVLVTLQNRSGQIMPLRLERELLDFNTYGLEEFWTEYHAQREQGISYRYGIILNFTQIRVSPERISEREERRSKRVLDRWEYKRDRNGNIIKDENGNPVKIEHYETVNAVVFITEQSKAVMVEGHVVYRDLEKNNQIERFPLVSEFIFEHQFATFQGDERALTPNDKLLINNRFVPFPDAAGMVYQAGEDIKQRLKEILKNHPL